MAENKKMIDEPEFKHLREALKQMERYLINIPKNQRGKGMGKKIRKIKKMNMGGVMRGRGGTFKGVY